MELIFVAGCALNQEVSAGRADATFELRVKANQVAGDGLDRLGTGGAEGAVSPPSAAAHVIRHVYRDWVLDDRGNKRSRAGDNVLTCAPGDYIALHGTSSTGLILSVAVRLARRY